jgi:hypothetical protein
MGGRTHEEVVCVRVGSANLEELHQVVELAVYVAADCDGAFLCHCERVHGAAGEGTGDIPLIARSTPPAKLRGPVVQLH